MKSTIRTLFLLSALLFSACEKDDSIFTELSIRFVMPDSRPVEKLEIRTDISYFDNINSGERVPFPAAEQNSATIRLRKGVYTFIVEADATYSTGEKKILRCTDYNQIPAAMTWVEDSESIVLLLKSICPLSGPFFCRYWRCCPPPLPPSAIRSAYWSVLPFSARRTNGP